MAEDESSDQMADLIEQHLVALTDGTPPPDLSALSGVDADLALDMLGIIETLVNAGPTEVPLSHDSVAIRLGLVDPPDGPAVELPDDPVTDAVRDAEQRYSFVASPTPTDGTAFERRFECRSMVENVLVVVTPQPGHYPLNAAHARSAFALSEELSAVAYCAADGSHSVVMTYGDCHDKVEPGKGWRSGTARYAAESLVVALARYFEQSDPRWEAVERLENLNAWDGLAEDVATVVVATLQGLAATGVRLAHKVAARDVVLGLSDDVFKSWATRVQGRELDGRALAAEIYERVWGDNP